MRDEIRIFLQRSQVYVNVLRVAPVDSWVVACVILPGFVRDKGVPEASIRYEDRLIVVWV